MLIASRRGGSARVGRSGWTYRSGRILWPRGSRRCAGRRTPIGIRMDRWSWREVRRRTTLRCWAGGRSRERAGRDRRSNEGRLPDRVRGSLWWTWLRRIGMDLRTTWRHREVLSMLRLPVDAGGRDTLCPRHSGSAAWMHSERSACTHRLLCCVAFRAARRDRGVSLRWHRRPSVQGSSGIRRKYPVLPPCRVRSGCRGRVSP